MGKIALKGYEFEEGNIRDSFNRRALAFKNAIIQTLNKLGIIEDQIEVNMENMAVAKKPASVEWYFDGRRHYYSYSGKKFVDNLFIVSKVISLVVQDVLDGRKTIEDFSAEFTEEKEVEDERKQAREYFGLQEGFTMADVDKAYKLLARDLHPDMPNGDAEKFKKLNWAHKILKRELT